MHLMCTVDAATGKRTYTLKKVLEGQVTKSAHPARFSPDDKWSRQRVVLRKRFGLLLMQKSTCFQDKGDLLDSKKGGALLTG